MIAAGSVGPRDCPAVEPALQSSSHLIESLLSCRVAANGLDQVVERLGQRRGRIEALEQLGIELGKVHLRQP
jgi:hypothetical protein